MSNDNPEIPTKEIDAFLVEVNKITAANEAIVNNSAGKTPESSNLPAPTNSSINTAQFLTPQVKQIAKFAVLAGAGWALYEVFTAGDELKKKK